MSTQAASTEYIELRCRADKSLMGRFKGLASGEIELKCRRCKKTYKFTFPTYHQRQQIEAQHKELGQSEAQN